MIKLIITIATLLLSAISFAQTEAKIFQTDIRGRSCNGGLGICSSSTNSLKNFTVISLDANAMIIEIETKMVSLEEQKMVFNLPFTDALPNEKLIFIQNSDFTFDAKQSKSLGLNVAYIIKKGNYVSKITDNKVQIILNLAIK